MTQIARRPALDPAPQVPQPPLIAFLRLAALACRAAPRGSIEACRLLGPDAGPGDHAMALARALPEMTLRRPVLWRPGTAGRSFDEAWLLSLQRALRAGDGPSVRFLTRSRVRAPAAPWLHLLLHGLAETLEDRGGTVM